MAFDGFFIRKMIKELEVNILHGRINKVNNLSTEHILIKLIIFQLMNLF